MASLLGSPRNESTRVSESLDNGSPNTASSPNNLCKVHVEWQDPHVVPLQDFAKWQFFLAVLGHKVPWNKWSESTHTDGRLPTKACYNYKWVSWYRPRPGSSLHGTIILGTRSLAFCPLGDDDSTGWLEVRISHQIIATDQPPSPWRLQNGIVSY